MTFTNINRSWDAPEGFEFQDVSAKGAFLRVSFRRTDEYTSGLKKISVVQVFINDMGREVFRTEHTETSYREAPEPPAREPVSRWSRFQAAFELALLGLQEMRKCLNKF
jgi:hypothetical protein